MLDLPFAYSSNGDGFAEHDFLTGKERQFGLDEFPTEEDLIARFKQESNMTPEQETAIAQPYYSSQTTFPPRYYQRIAVNRTVDAIARGQQMCIRDSRWTGFFALPDNTPEHKKAEQKKQGRKRSSYRNSYGHRQYRSHYDSMQPREGRDLSYLEQ